METKEFDFKGTKISGFLAIFIYLLVLTGSFLLFGVINAELAGFIFGCAVTLLFVCLFGFIDRKSTRLNSSH